jgi:hypothetical protein
MRKPISGRATVYGQKTRALFRAHNRSFRHAHEIQPVLHPVYGIAEIQKTVEESWPSWYDRL